MKTLLYVNACVTRNIESRTNRLAQAYLKKRLETQSYHIAMQFFADRVGGIANAVQKLSDTTYANLYDEAFAQEINSPNLRVRDALMYFRHPIEAPQQNAPANRAANEDLLLPNV